MDGESEFKDLVKHEELPWSLVVQQPMTDNQFNSLEYVHQLTQAGVPLPRAEAHAKALADVLATYLPTVTDVAVIKQALIDLNKRVDDLKDLATYLNGRIDRLETRLNWIATIIVATQLALFGMVAGLYLR